MAKVLFLDFDGVLNPFLYSNFLTKIWSLNKDRGVKSRDAFGDYFAPWCVEELQHIVNFTGCDIVISSSWRVHTDVHRMWEQRRLPGKLLGITPVGLGIPVGAFSAETTRGLEVEAWCMLNGIPEKFAILDDIDEFTGVWGGNNYVKTNAKFGLTRTETEQVINLLM